MSLTCFFFLYFLLDRVFLVRQKQDLLSLRIGLRQWFFWCQGFFWWIWISKMSVKMILRIIMKKSCSWFKNRVLLKIDFRTDGTDKSHPTPWELINRVFKKLTTVLDYARDWCLLTNENLIWCRLFGTWLSQKRFGLSKFSNLLKIPPRRPGEIKLYCRNSEF